jgi:hypothetical protein
MMSDGDPEPTLLGNERSAGSAERSGGLLQIADLLILGIFSVLSAILFLANPLGYGVVSATILISLAVLTVIVRTWAQ